MLMLRLNPSALSRALGLQLIERGSHLKANFESELLPVLGKRLLDKSLQRENSGSICFGSALTLYLVAQSCSPRLIVEVGAYIGNSAASLAYGAGLNGNPVELITCDVNPCCQNPLQGLSLPAGSSCKVDKVKSTEMFSLLVRQERKIDMLHLDGKLLADDIDLLRMLLNDETIIALDDCESNEKGHVNLDMLERSGVVKSHLYISPFPREIFRLWNLETYSRTGLLVPRTMIRFTKQ